MFIEIPATNQSIGARKSICGHGINDADYIVRQQINGTWETCPYYTVWNSMLTRCYSSNCHKKSPTYIGTTVCAEWLLFTTFRKWMDQQDWEGNQLDKDIIQPGNMTYAPEYCVFVSQEVNKLLATSAAKRGAFPQGVSAFRNKYQVQLCMYGKKRHIGHFNSPEEASVAYHQAKYAHLREIAMSHSDVRVREGLLKHAEIIYAK